MSLWRYAEWESGKAYLVSIWMQSQVEILGKVKGKNVPMVMHHSRNSQQKAWDETLVMALAGMGRILRSHFPVLSKVPDFDQVQPHIHAAYEYRRLSI